MDKFKLQEVEIKQKYQTRAMVYYRKRNEAKALDKQFDDEEPTYEQGRVLMDGTSLDKTEEEVKESTPMTEEEEEQIIQATQEQAMMNSLTLGITSFFTQESFQKTSKTLSESTTQVGQFIKEESIKNATELGKLSQMMA